MSDDRVIYAKRVRYDPEQPHAECARVLDIAKAAARILRTALAQIASLEGSTEALAGAQKSIARRALEEEAKL